MSEKFPPLCPKHFDKSQCIADLHSQGILRVCLHGIPLSLPETVWTTLKWAADLPHAFTVLPVPQ